ncbi:hypothetical protein MMC19_004158 [Ptychographa xylographoides]|nr:hypothetical protein [Ptychographa xylographoides]
MSIDNDSWYFLSVPATVPALLLDVYNNVFINTSAQLLVDNDVQVSGQWWHLALQPSGKYHLTTLFLGENKLLDTLSSTVGNSLVPCLTTDSGAPGQQWDVIHVSDSSYSLTNDDVGPNNYLGTCSNVDVCIVSNDQGNPPVWDFIEIHTLDSFFPLATTMYPGPSTGSAITSTASSSVSTTTSFPISTTTTSAISSTATSPTSNASISSTTTATSSVSRISSIQTDPGTVSNSSTTSGDLSVGSKVGIGIGLAIVVLIVVIAIYWCRYNRKKRTSPEVQDHSFSYAERAEMAQRNTWSPGFSATELSSGFLTGTMDSNSPLEHQRGELDSGAHYKISQLPTNERPCELDA